MIDNDFDRRKFLKIAIVLAATLRMSTKVAGAQELNIADDEDIAELKKMGKLYMKKYSSDQQGIDQTKKLLGDTKISSEEIIRSLQALMREDYKNNRIVNLLGWHVSRTEARVFAAT